jgi:hypothetical protein
MRALRLWTAAAAGPVVAAGFYASAAGHWPTGCSVDQPRPPHRPIPAGQLPSSLVIERRPRRRVRVFGCCQPIPLGLGLLSWAA